MSKYSITLVLVTCLYASDSETVSVDEAQTIALQDIRYSFSHLYDENPDICSDIVRIAVQQSTHTFFDYSGPELEINSRVRVKRLFELMSRLAKREEAKLPKKEYSFNSGTAKVRTKCGHIFHRSCLKAGLLTKCPLCRTKISVTKKSLEYIKYTEERRCAICLENFRLHKTAHGKIKKKN